jgi:Cu-Zn family superoxide dismutase
MASRIWFRKGVWMTWNRVAIVVGVSALVFASGAAAKKRKIFESAAEPPITKAVCILRPASGSNVAGRLVFREKDGRVEITGEVTGLKPGERGFHIHEYGDCSDAEAKCAGGHFNPTNAPHGGPNSRQRHDGDLGNLSADETGKAKVQMIDTVIRLNGPRSIIGRSVVVHADRDDLTTQPTGNAGTRIAVGVIGIGMPDSKH